MTTRSTTRRWVAIIVGTVAVLISLSMLSGLLRPPLDEETLRLSVFLRNEGVDVTASNTPGDTDRTALLLRDFRDTAQAEDLLRWVDSGGTLVVTDPGSEIVPAIGAEPAGTVAFLESRDIAPGCVTPQTEGVAALDVDGIDSAFSTDNTEAVACFIGEDGAFMLRRSRGSGTVIVLGGTSFLEDRKLAEANNAGFVLRLVGPTKKVTMLAAGAPEGTEGGGFWSTLPGPVRVIFLQLLVALVVYAIYRGRRLGQVPLEDPLIPISGNELVRARAGLYRQARARGHAASMVRSATLGRLMARLGGSPGEPTDVMADRVASATSMPAEEVRSAFDPSPPQDDIVLTTKERVMEKITSTAEGSS